jgi:fido (protein-threonine AMPylation protein)
VSIRPPHWPLLCDPAEKAELEAQNSVAQLDYVTSLVTEYQIKNVRETHILDLQRLAVEGIYPCGTQYRNARDETKITDTKHDIAHPALIANLVTDLVLWINTKRGEGRHEIECAAYALWRLNWIHPFRGGNGRTARMLAYLIICMALGHMLPGQPSIPMAIDLQHDEYIAALKAIDELMRLKLEKQNEVEGEPVDSDPDLTPMIDFLRPIVEAQTEAAVTAGESR